ncbi:glutamate receptor ionotropic, kainate 2-like [Anoplophora glabripennis]|uniref:glutamate receptor ionotropic, kainate 2-like n=2 Tax=Anoplophora glabripennis TaxID=217634 RepID=UPI000874A628|nr:glutamate receptor ionotropic, kainate 2-like [Anoplophora glabripennis]
MFLNWTLISVLIGYVFSESVNFAGLFDQNESHEKAFRYAVERVNRNVQEGEFTLVPLVTSSVSEDQPFPTQQHACFLLSQGVVSIFGPRHPVDIEAVQSVCDAKEIPHIITRWNYFPLRDSTEINFYPHPSMLSTAYFDIIMALEWKTFTVLYEDDEGLLRVLDLIKMAKDEGLLVTVIQLDRYHSGNYRTVLKDVKLSGQKYFVVDCEIEHLKEVLLQFQQVGLMNQDYHYFITNLDAHTEDLMPFLYAESNITGIRIINPDKELIQKISQELFADDENAIPEIVAWNLKTETALIIDAVHMFSTVLSDVKKQSSMPIINNNNILQCNDTSSWEQGYTIVNLLKTSSHEGLTGLIKFNTEGFRSDFQLDLFELREGGITDIGTWNTSNGLSVTKKSVEQPVPDGDSLKNKTFIVITTLTDPYGMLKETYETLTGNDRFEGFGIDLIKKLSEMEGFNYTFILREDKQNGAKDPKPPHRWSGMIGDLLEYRADLAITDFTITSDREEAVDFTVPFMNLGISVLFRKPFTAPPSFFSFADPFALDVWVALAGVFFLVSFSLFVIGRLCPDEWTNPYPCVEDPQYLINQFSMSNSIWFVTGSLMCQGSEIAPIAVSTRMVAGAWWFFCLLIVASYTANLAAFLATENPVELFKDVHSLYENAPLHNIKFGAKKNGATEKFFMNAEDGIFQKIGQYMKDHPEEQVKENDEGVRRAEKELYALFMESTSIEYTTQRHCDLQQYGGLLDDKGYGIAMRKESPYRKRLSTAILKLQASGVIEDLKRRWWEERRGGGQCSGTTESAEATPLGLKNVEGCFWVTIYGTILAFLFVIIEHLIYVLKVSRKAKISYFQAFTQEFKFFLDFNSNVKPVLSKSSLDKSESEDAKTKSKSRSTSRSPPPSKSKTKSLKESLNSKSNGTIRSGYPYGFIVPSSGERLDETQ